MELSVSRINDARLTLSGLRDFVETRSIEEFYEWCGIDYEQARACGGAVEPTSETANVLKQIRWKKEPGSEVVRRLFNQINTFHAERWAFANLKARPEEFLLNCLRLILFRQGKPLGLRTRRIAFGVRRDLDVLDPRRHFQLLQGIAPQFISRAIKAWSECVRRIPRDANSVLLLTMALIAIHPFADGNGRLARIAYTWLFRRFDLGDRWLREAEDGEFLRIGANIDSTEYLMGAFMKELCGGYNAIPLDSRSFSQEREECAVQALESALACNRTVFDHVTFNQLRQHLEETNHFSTSSTRFEALRHDIEL